MDVCKDQGPERVGVMGAWSPPSSSQHPDPLTVLSFNLLRSGMGLAE